MSDQPTPTESLEQPVAAVEQGQSIEPITPVPTAPGEPAAASQIADLDSKLNALQSIMKNIGRSMHMADDIVLTESVGNEIAKPSLSSVTAEIAALEQQHSGVGQSSEVLTLLRHLTGLVHQLQSRVESLERERDRESRYDGQVFIITNRESGKSLDVNGGWKLNATKLVVYSTHRQPHQRFKFRHVGNGLYKIAAEHSRQALDISSASKDRNALVVQFPWHGDDNQLWRIIQEPSEDGEQYFRLQNLNSELVMTATGRSDMCNVVQERWIPDSKLQQWRLEKYTSTQ